MTARDWADQDAAAIWQEIKVMQATRTGRPRELLARCLRAAEERGYERGRAEASPPTMLELGCENEDAHRAERAP